MNLFLRGSPILFLIIKTLLLITSAISVLPFQRLVGTNGHKHSQNYVFGISRYRVNIHMHLVKAVILSLQTDTSILFISKYKSQQEIRRLMIYKSINLSYLFFPSITGATTVHFQPRLTFTPVNLIGRQGGKFIDSDTCRVSRQRLQPSVMVTISNELEDCLSFIYLLYCAWGLILYVGSSGQRKQVAKVFQTFHIYINIFTCTRMQLLLIKVNYVTF